MPGYLLTGNRSFFVQIKSALLWLVERRNCISSLFTQKNDLTKYQFTIMIPSGMYILYSFATKTASDSILAKFFVLDTDGNSSYLLSSNTHTTEGRHYCSFSALGNLNYCSTRHFLRTNGWLLFTQKYEHFLKQSFVDEAFGRNHSNSLLRNKL